MKRVLLGMTAFVGISLAIGSGCKKESSNEPDMTKPADMATGSQDASVGDMTVDVVDMAMRTPGTGQIIVADVTGTLYAPASNVDGGVAATPGVHAVAAIAQFPRFEPILGTNDENTLNLTAFPPSGCTIQTFVPASGDVPESQINGGTVGIAPVNGSILGLSPPLINSPELLPSNGATIGCGLADAGGFQAYGCVFNAADSDMAAPWAGKRTDSSIFPTLPDSSGQCPSASYIHLGGFCIPNLIGATINLGTTGMGTFAATDVSKLNVSVPTAATISGITLGGTPIAGANSLDALEGAFNSNGALEISFACDGQCDDTAAGELGIVGLLAQTSTAKRGLDTGNNATFAVAQCIASIDTGKVTMSASQVTKLRAAAAGGSIRFTLARLNVRIDAGTATTQTVIRGAGRGNFAYINQ